MKQVNILVRADPLNGPTLLAVTWNRRKLVEVRVTDADLDELEAKVIEIVNRHV